MAVELGAFVIPDGERPHRTVVAAEAAPLDLVGIQDHPDQRRFDVGGGCRQTRSGAAGCHRTCESGH